MGVQTEYHLQSTMGLPPVSRIEVLSGPTGRRRWSDEIKCQMVAESLDPNVSVREVAERYGIAANHLSTWRGLARQGKLVDPTRALQAVLSKVEFAALEVSNIPAPPPVPAIDFIELETGDVILRFGRNTNIEDIASLVCALRDKSCRDTP